MASFLQVMAIPIAAVASWIAGGLWYGAFGARWQAVLGRDSAGMSRETSPVTMALSFAAELAMAVALAILIGALGHRSAAGGLGIAVLAWVGFVATTLGSNHAFAGAHPHLTLIDGGHWLVVLLIQGLIIGGLAVA